MSLPDAEVTRTAEDRIAVNLTALQPPVSSSPATVASNILINNTDRETPSPSNNDIMLEPSQNLNESTNALSAPRNTTESEMAVDNSSNAPLLSSMQLLGRVSPPTMMDTEPQNNHSSSSSAIRPASPSPLRSARRYKTPFGRSRSSSFGSSVPSFTVRINRSSSGGSRPSTSSSNARVDFSLSAMPRDKIQKRTLFPWSVHHSLQTSNWIATISRPALSESGAPTNKLRYVQFIFKTEREARKFCKAYAPPKMVTGDGRCHLCMKGGCFKHCKNCGVLCCDNDMTKWSCRMIPKTYVSAPQTSQVVRVCKTCDWLSNAFCMSLLQGRYDDALELYETGNINLRTCFADIHREAMFPVHCAVMGGSLDLLKWLVDTHLVPISARADKDGRGLSVQTSAHRTLLDLAMTGKPKVDILAYLVKKGLSIHDAKDPSLTPKTLEAILLSDFTMNEAAMPLDLNIVESIDESVATIDDACNICLEKPMNCVLTPCGHQFCCHECGERLERCPVCKADCNVLRVYKS